MKRENGFYWVKFRFNWRIGEFVNSYDEVLDGTKIDESYWNVQHFKDYFHDSDFEEINEQRILSPDEITAQINNINEEIVKQANKVYNSHNVLLLQKENDLLRLAVNSLNKQLQTLSPKI
jgi:hypothetical protein